VTATAAPPSPAPAPAPPEGGFRLRRPPAARLTSGKVFYGWYVAVACTVMMYVTVGVSYYGLGLFLRPLRDEHNWSNGVVSGATGAFFLISGLASLVAGPWIDRWGPRVFLGVGIVLTAIGAASVGFVSEVWHLYLAYGLLAVAYGLGAVVPVSTLMSRWFIHKRAKAMMVSSTGVSLGGATLVPIGAILIERGGLRLAAPVLGAVVLGVALPVLLLVISQSPAEMGLRPDGGVAPPATTRIDEASQYRVWTRPEVLRSWSFWAIVVAFFLCLAAQTAVLIYQLTFLQEPNKLGSRGAAALAVTTTTVGSILARIVVSLFADRLDKRYMAAVLFVLQAGAIAGYLAVHSTVAIYAVALVFGFTIGNIYMSQSLLVGELYGLMSFGTVYGMVALAGQIGSGLGLIGLGRLIDLSGGYTEPFLLLAAFDLVAAVVVLGAVSTQPAAGRIGPPASGPGRRWRATVLAEVLGSAPVASSGWACGMGGAVVEHPDRPATVEANSPTRSTG
jgi:sugar phosphate permease